MNLLALAAVLSIAQGDVEGNVDLLGLLWTFANSDVGLAIVSAVLVAFLGWLFRKQPGWEKVFEDHKGLFFDAVKQAEKAVPDDSDHSAARKADKALEFVLKLQPALSRKREADVKRAISKAHAEAEQKGKLGKKA